MSDAVLKDIEAEGLEYIVWVKMRKVKAMEEVLSRAGRYKEVKSNLKVKEVDLEGERYVVCLNPEETEHDCEAREEMVIKLKKRLQKDGLKSLVGNSGYRRFLRVTGTEACVDDDAVKEKARLDGKYVLRTNNGLFGPKKWPWPTRNSGESNRLSGR